MRPKLDVIKSRRDEFRQDLDSMGLISLKIKNSSDGRLKRSRWHEQCGIRKICWRVRKWYIEQRRRKVKYTI